MILGCVLAGGLSRRFGSDKALAEIDGKTLLARSVDLLSGWCEHVVVVGREDAPAPTLPDWPHAHMGPLGGLAAALHLARDEGFAAVLTLGVDVAGLPENLPDLLAPAPAFVETLPVIGLWPASISPQLDAMLEGDGRHAIYALAEAIGARSVRLAVDPANFNTPEDLVAFKAKARTGEDEAR